MEEKNTQLIKEISEIYKKEKGTTIGQLEIKSESLIPQDFKKIFLRLTEGEHKITGEAGPLGYNKYLGFRKYRDVFILEKWLFCDFDAHQGKGAEKDLTIYTPQSIPKEYKLRKQGTGIFS